MAENCTKYDGVLIALRKITRAIDLHSKHLMQQYGLTGPQMLLLKTVVRGGAAGVGGRELASSMSLSHATVTIILDRLESKAYITREKSRLDKRKTLIKATAKTKQIFSQNPSLLQEHFVNKFSKLKAWEQSQLLCALERIADMMNAEALEAAPVLANSELIKVEVE